MNKMSLLSTKSIGILVSSALLSATLFSASAFSADCGQKIKLKSWKGDYLHRPDSKQGVTTWGTGIGNEWIVETIE